MSTLRMTRGAVRLGAMWVTLAAAAGVALAGTPPATNQLQDIPVFKDQLLGHLVRRRHLPSAPSYDQLPIDTTQMYGGLPSLRFEVQGPNQWWWTSILAGQDWMPYSVEHYRAGRLPRVQREGRRRGRSVHPPLGDLDNARTPAETTCPTVGSWNYVSARHRVAARQDPAQRAHPRRHGGAARHLPAATAAGAEVR